MTHLDRASLAGGESDSTSPSISVCNQSERLQKTLLLSYNTLRMKNARMMAMAIETTLLHKVHNMHEYGVLHELPDLPVVPRTWFIASKRIKERLDTMLQIFMICLEMSISHRQRRCIYSGFRKPAANCRLSLKPINFMFPPSSGLHDPRPETPTQ